MSGPSSREGVLANLALVTGALVWGVIWYPYRVLQGAGIGGVAAALLTYAVALLVGLLLLHRHLASLRPTPLLVLIALSAGGCNLGYVVATLQGEVMRVLLLFYLAPLWTVLWSRILLGERLTAGGGLVIALSLAGAATMLWHAERGAPWPRGIAEWTGLAAGLLFALTNVLIRRAESISIETKSLAVCVGVIAVAALLLAFGLEPLPAAIDSRTALLVATIGLVLIFVNLVVQYGLMRVAANRAIVILLCELVFAALSSWWLAGETMGAREWAGGVMIAAASLFSARMEAASPA